MNTLPSNPYVLVSFMNTLLRNRNKNLSDVCEEFDIKEEELKSKLASIGYDYNPTTKQFQPIH